MCLTLPSCFLFSLDIVIKQSVKPLQFQVLSSCSSEKLLGKPNHVPPATVLTLRGTWERQDPCRPTAKGRTEVCRFVKASLTSGSCLHTESLIALDLNLNPDICEQQHFPQVNLCK